MKRIEFSFIVPVYNTKKYLKKCIDSLLQQTYKDFEIIVVDDGSTDDSFNYLIENYGNNSYIKIYSKENSGVSDTRNYAISKCSGEWIVFVDSDDWIETDALFNIKKIIEKDKEIEALSSKLIINDSFNSNNEYVDFIISGDKTKILASIYSNIYVKKVFNENYENTRCIGGKIYKSDLIKKNKLFFNINYKYFEDGVFNLYAIKNSKKVVITDYSFYHYRIVENSATRKYDVERYFNNNELINELKLISNGNRDLEKCYSYTCFELLRTLTNNIVNTYKIKNIKKGIILLKKGINKFKNESNEIDIELKNLSIEGIIYFILIKLKLYFIIYILYILKNKNILFKK